LYDADKTFRKQGEKLLIKKGLSISITKGIQGIQGKTILTKVFLKTMD